MKFKGILLLLLMAVSGCQSIPEAQVAVSDQGMAAAAHPLATAAANQVLEAGGNAADAAIAAAFTLTVVEPTMNHLGGRNQILIRNPNGSFQGYNGMTEVPAGYTRPADPVSQGYGTIATPGVVAALGRLHEEHGSLAWSNLLQAAIKAADEGFKVLPGEAIRQRMGFDLFKDNPGFQQSFLKADGSLYIAGDLLRQPDLANTLRLLADEGADAFYRGKIASQIASDMAAHGGFVTAEDLENYKVLDGRMISTDYRGFQVHSLAAPAGGGLVVKVLNILENFSMDSVTEGQWAAIVNQAIAIAIMSMADDYTESDLAAVASKSWGTEQASRIRVPYPRTTSGSDESIGTLAESGLSHVEIAAAEQTDWSGNTWGADSHHTTHFVTADCDGQVVSITQTLGPLFGSRVITPGLGFVYASTMGSYLSSADQNPGSRPRTTIAPTVVMRDGEVVMVLGAAGGIRILSAIVQTISRHIDRGMSLATAVASPRVHPQAGIDEEGNPEFYLDKLHLETTPQNGWNPAIASMLTATGFEIDPVDRYAAFGRVHALSKSAEGSWTGVADLDWEGVANGPASSKCSARR